MQQLTILVKQQLGVQPARKIIEAVPTAIAHNGEFQFRPRGILQRLSDNQIARGSHLGPQPGDAPRGESQCGHEEEDRERKRQSVAIRSSVDGSPAELGLPGELPLRDFTQKPEKQCEKRDQPNQESPSNPEIDSSSEGNTHKHISGSFGERE